MKSAIFLLWLCVALVGADLSGLYLGDYAVKKGKKEPFAFVATCFKEGKIKFLGQILPVTWRHNEAQKRFELIRPDGTVAYVLNIVALSPRAATVTHRGENGEETLYFRRLDPQKAEQANRQSGLIGTRWRHKTQNGVTTLAFKAPDEMACKQVQNGGEVTTESLVFWYYDPAKKSLYAAGMGECFPSDTYTVSLGGDTLRLGDTTFRKAP